jgi:thioredoxin reductase
MANSDPEILLVGAGPVGLTAALEPARRLRRLRPILAKAGGKRR